MLQGPPSPIKIREHKELGRIAQGMVKIPISKVPDELNSNLLRNITMHY